MGLGKTVQALAMIVRQFERGSGPFDHVARGDAVDECLGQAADGRHAAILATNRRLFETVRAPLPRFRHKILAFALGLG